jgi:hypothetical protein
VTILLVVLGLLLVLLSIISHGFAYVWGQRHAAKVLHTLYYAPMVQNHERLRRELIMSAVQDDATLARKNLVLILRMRRLRWKTLKYVQRCRRYRKQIRRLRGDWIHHLIETLIIHSRGLK